MLVSRIQTLELIGKVGHMGRLMVASYLDILSCYQLGFGIAGYRGSLLFARGSGGGFLIGHRSIEDPLIFNPPPPILLALLSGRERENTHEQWTGVLVMGLSGPPRRLGTLMYAP